MRFLILLTVFILAGCEKVTIPLAHECPDGVTDRIIEHIDACMLETESAVFSYGIKCRTEAHDAYCERVPDTGITRYTIGKDLD